MGNVYIKYASEEGAVKCVQVLNGRYYAGTLYIYIYNICLINLIKENLYLLNILLLLALENLDVVNLIKMIALEVDFAILCIFVG
jgi:hypothetical protein